tara:strand:- start:1850 stop:2194 length:345 start_codon:yes stop_codon:yes gene_type:complete
MKVVEMRTGSWGKIRAFFQLETAEGFTIKNFKLVEGINGLFVGFPSEKGKDDEYHDTVWADKDLKDKVIGIAVDEYKKKMGDAFTDDVPEMSLDQVSNDPHFNKAPFPEGESAV